MKKLFFILMLFHNVIFGQSQESVNAFIKSLPDSLGRPVKMPKRSYNQAYPPEWSLSYKIKQRVYVISSDSIYHLIFAEYRYTIDSLKKFIFSDNDSSWYKQMFRYLSDSFPVIDFSRYQLVLYSACGQCLAFCNHDKHNGCHRNLCNFMEAWFLRDKQRFYVKKVEN